MSQQDTDLAASQVVLSRRPAWIRVIALLVLQIFTLEQIAFAAPSQRSIFSNKQAAHDAVQQRNLRELMHKKGMHEDQSQVTSNKLQAGVTQGPISLAALQDLSALQIPSEDGQILEVWQPAEETSDTLQVTSGGDPLRAPTIIILQDLHTQPDAQMAEGRIMEHLNKTYNVRLVAAEGAEGELDLEFFRRYPKDPAIRDAVAQAFLNVGQMKGHEYQAITRNVPVVISGVEDMRLHEANGKVFQELLDVAPKSQEALSQIQGALAALESELYSDALRRFEQRVAAFEAGELDLTGYAAELLSLSQEYGVPFETYAPHVAMVQRAQTLEAQIDRSAVETEMRRLLGDVNGSLQAGAAEHRQALEELVGRFQAGQISAGYFYPALMSRSQEAGVNVAAYPALAQFTEYLEVSSSVESHRIGTELDALRWELADRMAERSVAGEDARQLLRLTRHARLLQELFALHLTPDQLAYYETYRDEFRMQEFRAFLEKQLAKHKIPNALTYPPELLDDQLHLPERFYALARQRDRVLIENTLALIQGNKLQGTSDKKAEAVLLVVGGFHTPGMTALLRERKVPYVVVTPTAAGEMDEARYHRLVRGETAGYEELIAETANAYAQRAGKGRLAKKDLQSFDPAAGRAARVPWATVVSLVLIFGLGSAFADTLPVNAVVEGLESFKSLLSHEESINALIESIHTIAQPDGTGVGGVTISLPQYEGLVQAAVEGIDPQAVDGLVQQAATLDPTAVTPEVVTPGELFPGDSLSAPSSEPVSTPEVDAEPSLPTPVDVDANAPLPGADAAPVNIQPADASSVVGATIAGATATRREKLSILSLEAKTVGVVRIAGQSATAEFVKQLAQGLENQGVELVWRGTRHTPAGFDGGDGGLMDSSEDAYLIIHANVLKPDQLTGILPNISSREGVTTYQGREAEAHLGGLLSEAFRKSRLAAVDSLKQGDVPSLTSYSADDLNSDTPTDQSLRSLFSLGAIVRLLLAPLTTRFQAWRLQRAQALALREIRDALGSITDPSSVKAVVTQIASQGSRNGLLSAASTPLLTALAGLRQQAGAEVINCASRIVGATSKFAAISHTGFYNNWYANDAGRMNVVTAVARLIDAVMLTSVGRLPVQVDWFMREESSAFALARAMEMLHPDQGQYGVLESSIAQVSEMPELGLYNNSSSATDQGTITVSDVFAHFELEGLGHFAPVRKRFSDEALVYAVLDERGQIVEWREVPQDAQRIHVIVPISDRDRASESTGVRLTTAQELVLTGSMSRRGGGGLVGAMLGLLNATLKLANTAAELGIPLNIRPQITEAVSAKAAVFNVNQASDAEIGQLIDELAGFRTSDASPRVIALLQQNPAKVFPHAIRHEWSTTSSDNVVAIAPLLIQGYLAQDASVTPAELKKQIVAMSAYGTEGMVTFLLNQMAQRPELAETVLRALTTSPYTNMSLRDVTSTGVIAAYRARVAQERDAFTTAERRRWVGRIAEVASDETVEFLAEQLGVTELRETALEKLTSGPYTSATYADSASAGLIAAYQARVAQERDAFTTTERRRWVGRIAEVASDETVEFLAEQLGVTELRETALEKLTSHPYTSRVYADSASAGVIAAYQARVAQERDAFTTTDRQKWLARLARFDQRYTRTFWLGLVVETPEVVPGAIAQTLTASVQEMTLAEARQQFAVEGRFARVIRKNTVAQQNAELLEALQVPAGRRIRLAADAEGRLIAVAPVSDNQLQREVEARVSELRAAFRETIFTGKGTADELQDVVEAILGKAGLTNQFGTPLQAVLTRVAGASLEAVINCACRIARARGGLAAAALLRVIDVVAYVIYYGADMTFQQWQALLRGESSSYALAQSLNAQPSAFESYQVVEVSQEELDGRVTGDITETGQVLTSQEVYAQFKIKRGKGWENHFSAIRQSSQDGRFYYAVLNDAGAVTTWELVESLPDKVRIVTNKYFLLSVGRKLSFKEQLECTGACGISTAYPQPVESTPSEILTRRHLRAPRLALDDLRYEVARRTADPKETVEDMIEVLEGRGFDNYAHVEKFTLQLPSNVRYDALQNRLIIPTEDGARYVPLDAHRQRAVSVQGGGFELRFFVESRGAGSATANRPRIRLEINEQIATLAKVIYGPNAVHQFASNGDALIATAWLQKFIVKIPGVRRWWWARHGLPTMQLKTVLEHTRYKTKGGDREENSHHWMWKGYTLGHNGDFECFGLMKLLLAGYYAQYQAPEGIRVENFGTLPESLKDMFMNDPISVADMLEHAATPISPSDERAFVANALFEGTGDSEVFLHLLGELGNQHAAHEAIARAFKVVDEVETLLNARRVLEAPSEYGEVVRKAVIDFIDSTYSEIAEEFGRPAHELLLENSAWGTTDQAIPLLVQARVVQALQSQDQVGRQVWKRKDVGPGAEHIVPDQNEGGGQSLMSMFVEEMGKVKKRAAQLGRGPVEAGAQDQFKGVDKASDLFGKSVSNIALNVSSLYDEHEIIVARAGPPSNDVFVGLGEKQRYMASEVRAFGPKIGEPEPDGSVVAITSENGKPVMSIQRGWVRYTGPEEWSIQVVQGKSVRERNAISGGRLHEVKDTQTKKRIRRERVKWNVVHDLGAFRMLTAFQREIELQGKTLLWTLKSLTHQVKRLGEMWHAVNVRKMVARKAGGSGLLSGRNTDGELTPFLQAAPETVRNSWVIMSIALRRAALLEEKRRAMTADDIPDDVCNVLGPPANLAVNRQRAWELWMAEGKINAAGELVARPNESRHNEPTAFFQEQFLKAVFEHQKRNTAGVGAGTSFNAIKLINGMTFFFDTPDTSDDMRAQWPNWIGSGSVVVLVSQSGTTGSTKQVAKEARKRGAFVITVTNREGSALDEYADLTLVTESVDEMAVAATGSNSSQDIALELIHLVDLQFKAERLLAQGRIHRAANQPSDAGRVEREAEGLLQYVNDRIERGYRIADKLSSVVQNLRDRGHRNFNSLMQLKEFINEKTSRACNFVFASAKSFAQALAEEGRLKVQEVMSDGAKSHEDLPQMLSTNDSLEDVWTGETVSGVITANLGTFTNDQGQTSAAYLQPIHERFRKLNLIEQLQQADELVITGNSAFAGTIQYLYSQYKEQCPITLKTRWADEALQGNEAYDQMLGKTGPHSKAVSGKNSLIVNFVDEDTIELWCNGSRINSFDAISRSASGGINAEVGRMIAGDLTMMWLLSQMKQPNEYQNVDRVKERVAEFSGQAGAMNALEESFHPDGSRHFESDTYHNAVNLRRFLEHLDSLPADSPYADFWTTGKGKDLPATFDLARMIELLTGRAVGAGEANDFKHGQYASMFYGLMTIFIAHMPSRSDPNFTDAWKSAIGEVLPRINSAYAKFARDMIKGQGLLVFISNEGELIDDAEYARRREERIAAYDKGQPDLTFKTVTGGVFERMLINRKIAEAAKVHYDRVKQEQKFQHPNVLFTYNAKDISGQRALTPQIIEKLKQKYNDVERDRIVLITDADDPLVDELANDSRFLVFVVDEGDPIEMLVLNHMFALELSKAKFKETADWLLSFRKDIDPLFDKKARPDPSARPKYARTPQELLFNYMLTEQETQGTSEKQKRRRAAWQEARDFLVNMDFEHGLKLDDERSLDQKLFKAINEDNIDPIKALGAATSPEALWRVLIDLKDKLAKVVTNLASPRGARTAAWVSLGVSVVAAVAALMFGGDVIGHLGSLVMGAVGLWGLAASMHFFYQAKMVRGPGALWVTKDVMSMGQRELHFADADAFDAQIPAYMKLSLARHEELHAKGFMGITSEWGLHFIQAIFLPVDLFRGLVLTPYTAREMQRRVDAGQDIRGPGTFDAVMRMFELLAAAVGRTLDRFWPIEAVDTLGLTNAPAIGAEADEAVGMAAVVGEQVFEEDLVEVPADLIGQAYESLNAPQGELPADATRTSADEGEQVLVEDGREATDVEAALADYRQQNAWEGDGGQLGGSNQMQREQVGEAVVAPNAVVTPDGAIALSPDAFNFDALLEDLFGIFDQLMPQIREFWSSVTDFRAIGEAAQRVVARAGEMIQAEAELHAALVTDREFRQRVMTGVAEKYGLQIIGFFLLAVFAYLGVSEFSGDFSASFMLPIGALNGATIKDKAGNEVALSVEGDGAGARLKLTPAGRSVWTILAAPQPDADGSVTLTTTSGQNFASIMPMQGGSERGMLMLQMREKDGAVSVDVSEAMQGLTCELPDGTPAAVASVRGTVASFLSRLGPIHVASSTIVLGGFSQAFGGQAVKSFVTSGVVVDVVLERQLGVSNKAKSVGVYVAPGSKGTTGVVKQALVGQTFDVTVRGEDGSSSSKTITFVENLWDSEVSKNIPVVGRMQDVVPARGAITLSDFKPQWAVLGALALFTAIYFGADGSDALQAAAMIAVPLGGNSNTTTVANAVAGNVSTTIQTAPANVAALPPFRPEQDLPSNDRAMTLAEVEQAVLSGAMSLQDAREIAILMGYTISPEVEAAVALRQRIVPDMPGGGAGDGMGTVVMATGNGSGGGVALLDFEEREVQVIEFAAAEMRTSGSAAATSANTRVELSNLALVISADVVSRESGMFAENLQALIQKMQGFNAPGQTPQVLIVATTDAEKAAVAAVTTHQVVSPLQLQLLLEGENPFAPVFIGNFPDLALSSPQLLGATLAEAIANGDLAALFDGMRIGDLNNAELQRQLAVWTKA